MCTVLRRNTCSMENFKEVFYSSIQSRKMANIEYHADFLLPNLYHYPEENFPKIPVQDFLHLLGGGNLNALSPFSFHFSPMKCALLLCTDSGVGRVTTAGGTEYSVTDRQILLLDCNQPFSLQTVVLPWSFKLFFVGGNALSSYTRICRTQNCHTFTLTSISPVLHSIRSLLSVPRETDCASLLFMNQKLTEILSLLTLSCYPAVAKPQANVPWYLIEMKDFLDNHFNQNFSLSHFEELYKINRYRLCREFSAHYELAPLQYLTRRRIEEAKKILLTTDLSIHEVSSMIGYENTNHFINLFKKYVSMTPGKFRQTELQERSVSRCPSPQTSQAT